MSQGLFIRRKADNRRQHPLYVLPPPRSGKGEEESPFGPLIGDASSRQAGAPYNGYYYRILKKQGPAAPAGRYNYVVNGHMIGGYALIAYPADYGNSGVKTFIVNHYGDVYEKALGPNTVQRAAAITEYNPGFDMAACL